MSNAKWRRIIGSTLAAAALIAVLVITPQRGFAEERKIRTKITPVYPELARRSNISGVVKIQAVIAPNGTVKSTKPLGGHPILVGPAEDALKKWKYEPSSDETTTVVEFNFNAGM